MWISVRSWCGSWSLLVMDHDQFSVSISVNFQCGPRSVFRVSLGHFSVSISVSSWCESRSVFSVNLGQFSIWIPVSFCCDSQPVLSIGVHGASGLGLKGLIKGNKITGCPTPVDLTGWQSDLAWLACCPMDGGRAKTAGMLVAGYFKSSGRAVFVALHRGAFQWRMAADWCDQSDVQCRLLPRVVPKKLVQFSLESTKADWSCIGSCSCYQQEKQTKKFKLKKKEGWLC